MSHPGSWCVCAADDLKEVWLLSVGTIFLALLLPLLEPLEQLEELSLLVDLFNGWRWEPASPPDVIMASRIPRARL